jgi:hypothetical protein
MGSLGSVEVILEIGMKGAILKELEDGARARWANGRV